MRRTERLFQIIQILRRARRPITGQHLAEELEVSLRTLYRDMAELIAQRVPIRGEAGTGYVLDRGYDLPPLMLTADELEAAVLGAKWVAARGDDALARGAEDLIAKLSSVVPPELEPVIVDAGVFPVTKSGNRIKDSFDVSLARSASSPNGSTRATARNWSARPIRSSCPPSPRMAVRNRNWLAST